MLYHSARALRAPARNVLLQDAHVGLGAKMGDFGGFNMPLQYVSLTPKASAVHTREKASIFDVSHMCSYFLRGPGGKAFAERCTTASVQGMPLNTGGLSVVPNANGGLVDDCMVNVVEYKGEELVYMVLNAGNADKDIAHMRGLAQRPGDFGGASFEEEVAWFGDRGLFALQGPTAPAVFAAFFDLPPGKTLPALLFGGSSECQLKGAAPGVDPCLVTRCGYTGEDGFEIFIPGPLAQQAWEDINAHADVAPAGLVARDILRVEAGLCLYGHELNEEITPAEAALSWVVAKDRRGAGAIPFEGKERIMAQIGDRSLIKKIRMAAHFPNMPPPREGATLCTGDAGSDAVGTVTSSAPSTRNKGFNVMGYATRGAVKSGGALSVRLNERRTVQGVACKTPFVPHRYYRGQG